MLELSAVRRQPRAKELREQAHWLIVVPLVESAADWPAIPWRELLVARAGQRGFELEKPAAMATELPDEAGTRVLLATAGAHSGAFERLGWARARIKTLADARAEAERLRGDLADARERIRELEHQAETQSPPESAVAQVFSQNRETLVSDIGVTTTILPRLRQRIENGESITRAVRRIYGSRDNGLTEFLCDKLPDRCK